MAEDSWSYFFSTSSNLCRSSLQSRSDLCFDFEEIEGDDDLKAEFPCPFCSDEFDITELCYHIEDEHPCEANIGVCPVCDTRVDRNMVGHITTQHANIFKIQQKLELLKGESNSTLSFLKKELEDAHLNSLLGRSSRVVSPSNMAPDPLLSSFFYHLPTVDESESVQLSSPTEASLAEKSTDETILDRNTQPSPLSDKDQEEKAKRSEFVQGLLWSTIFDDSL
ncbi:hypothetical protein L1049_004002 [Liquidambar formosana]|uniref:Uncharacterized protein n=1 Tax=Liquidambar formosana TaxID=63359 RepID=A0AAP0WVA9_LIQFO